MKLIHLNTYKKQRILFLMLILFSFAATSFADVAIIVHRDNNSNLTAEDIRDIFLKKTKSFTNGQKALPINQKRGTDIRNTVIEKILKKNSSQETAYWAHYQFSGKGRRPKVVNGDKNVISFVAKNKFAIGYVDRKSINDSVKVVYIIKTE